MKFSLDWFKSEKQKENEKLQLENEKLRNEYLKVSIENENKLKSIGEASDVVLSMVEQRPFLNIKMTNDVLTIVLRDGTLLSKSNATRKDFDDARQAITEERLLEIASGSELLMQKKAKEAEEKALQKMLDGISSLSKEHFLTREDSVYMIDEKGKVIERSIPQLLLERFYTITGDVSFDKNNIEYQALRKFWMKCCLNPSSKSAEDLYTFLSNHKFKIDKHGNFYAYRRVVSKNDKENKKFVDFISNSYIKIKAVWKKKPVDYWVHKNEETNELTFSKNQYSEFNDLGNLQDLYLDLPNMQKEAYTSHHTGLEDYKVGEVISMPRFEGDDNNSISCSKGFHAASRAYDYSRFGNTPILVIINPMDVLAVPLGEVGKLRTSRWFFAMTLTKEEQYILDDDSFDVTDLGDVFEEKCLENLQEYVQNSYAEEVKRHTFAVPTISAKEISSIVHSLEDMKKAISGRVKVVLN